jgi:hypothetical protein
VDDVILEADDVVLKADGVVVGADDVVLRADGVVLVMSLCTNQPVTAWFLLLPLGLQSILTNKVRSAGAN